MDRAELAARLRAGETITQATFAGFDWADLDAEAAHFVACRFVDAQFSNTNLAEARFDQCHLPGARFSRSNLIQTQFTNCIFADAAAAERGPAERGAAFFMSELQQASFVACGLSFARFERSDLFAITFDQCQLRGARFSKADFSRAISRKLVQTQASFRHCNLELADLAEASLAGADFTGSRLREADLSATDLTGAIFREADLFQSLLVQTKLDGADLCGAEISGLRLGELAGYAGLKITPGQQHILLSGIGIDICPED